MFVACMLLCIGHGCAARDSYIIHKNVPASLLLAYSVMHTIHILFREPLYIFRCLIFYFLETILYSKFVRLKDKKNTLLLVVVTCFGGSLKIVGKVSTNLA